MEINKKYVDDIVVFKVVGEIIVENRHILKESIKDELNKGKMNFVLDFSEMKYIDSAGLGILVIQNKKVNESGGKIKLSSLSKDILSLFSLTHLDKAFDIYNSIDDAIKSFAG
ncbi:MAG: STAS domain-containing protein [bacterium]|nr:STAS domain-containing protein [bacterium]